MVVVRDLVLLMHLIGFALLAGGLLTQATDDEPRVSAAMVWGAAVMLISGVGLAGAEIGPTNWPKIGVKFLVFVPLAVLVFVNSRWESIPKGLWALLLAFVAADLGIAVLWH